MIHGNGGHIRAFALSWPICGKHSVFFRRIYARLLKGISTYRFKSFAETYGRESLASVKRAVAYRGHAVGNGYAFDSRACVKRRFAYS